MAELIRVEGLTKSFYTAAGELRVLKGIDAEIAEGEMVSIVGISGAGKSTFLHILGTLDKPTEGSVFYTQEAASERIDPFSLDDIALASFRNGTIGFVFQFHYLLPEFTALENVLMPGLISQRKASRRGLQKKTRAELLDTASALLQDLSVYERRSHKPGELSGGEQQRVAVARALLLEPKVIFADEPTGNLDAATGEELFSLLRQVNERSGVTFVIVTHNESLSRRCHRTLEMADGRLVRR